MIARDLSEATAHFELSDHLPHLFKHINTQLCAVTEADLAEFDLSVAAWRILAVLWEYGDVSHRELADLTAIEVSTLSRVSKGVKRNGLIRRTRDAEDQRVVRVALTDKGRSLTEAIIPSALSCQADLVATLSCEDVHTLTRILQVIVQNLGAHLRARGHGDKMPPFRDGQFML